MHSSFDSRIVIVGAGAAGLWAAGRVARALGSASPGGAGSASERASVLLLEKTPRAGSKVLASGGTRCNLTTTLGPVEAAKLFGPRGERFLKHAFRALPPLAVRERFAALGVPTEEAPLEKVFPTSGRAVDVRDALERDAREAGARILFECGVQSVRRGERGFVLELSSPARAPGRLGAPGTTRAPGTVGAPGTTGSPDAPAAPGTTGASDAPAAPGTTGAPDAPAASGTAGAPDAPGARDTAGVPRSSRASTATSASTQAPSHAAPTVHELHCERLILCPGGKSYPKTGTTGDGYRWIADLGLPLVDPVPALVPLTSPEAWARELTGIALQNAEARLVDAERRVLGKRRRPLVFTHHGVSGPAAMDLSVHVSRARASALRQKTKPPCFTLEIDLAPSIERERMRLLLIEAAGKPGNPVLGRALGELLVANGAEALPRRLFARIAAQAGLDVDVRANGLDKERRHRLVESLKSFAVLIDGTLGWDQAEVSSGGLALEAVDPATMQVKGIEGLFVCGELLDLCGVIGGLSFQSAFATAELASRAVMG